MTKKEWIDKDLSFYHVTPKSNIPSILEEGLKKGISNPIGICVIRSIHPSILEYLCQAMLFRTDETTFAVIEIKPSKHGLKVNDIVDDHVVEATNKLHNYILRNVLKIEMEDIISIHEMKLNGILDYEQYVQQLRDLKIIEALS